MSHSRRSERYTRINRDIGSLQEEEEADKEEEGKEDEKEKQEETRKRTRFFVF